MSTPRQAADPLDDVFRAIADPTRRLILDALRPKPLNTSALVAANDSMTRAGVINHIKVLEAAELIRVEVRGRERINHLNATRLQGVYERWLNPFEQIWSSKLEGLARVAEVAATQPQEEPMPNPPVQVVEIVQQRTCAAPPDAVWDALTDHVDQWWTQPFVAENSTGLTLYLEPGGTLWDARPQGGYALAIVRGFTKGRELILDGEFGVPGALSGRLVVDLEDLGDSTTITFTNTAIGAIPDHLPDNEAGWHALLGNLTQYAETSRSQ